MEKPLERTLDAAMNIARTCEQAGIQAGVVFQNRYRDGALQLKKRMAEGALGDVYSVQLSVPWWRDQSYYDEPLRGSYERDGGGVLISQAIHTIDLMLSLAGPVSQVAAMTATTAAHTMESEDFVGAAMRFVNGAVGSLVATTAQYPGALERITLCGTLGTAQLEGGELIINYRDGRTEAVGEAAAGGGTADPMAFSFEWHQKLIADFLDAIDEDREPQATLSQALNSHRLIDALVRSSNEERHIDVEYPA